MDNNRESLILSSFDEHRDTPPPWPKFLAALFSIFKKEGNWLINKTGARKRCKRDNNGGSLAWIIAVNVIISAITGTLFGYYGSNLIEPILGTTPTIIRREVQQSQIFAEDELVVAVANKSSPAVVSIVATRNVAINSRPSKVFNIFCDDPFFRQFFGSECDRALAPDQPQVQKQQVSAGSGFFVRADGLIVTNKHVVEVNQADFTVITKDGKEYAAKILAKDPLNDLAIMQIAGGTFPVLPLGDSSVLQVGQSVIAIGNALGEFSNTVSRGVISGLSRSITASSGVTSERLEQLIQTDAAINPGNSGGPLLNLKGEVVGINTAIAEGAQNIGFALPVNQIKKAVNDVSTLGKIAYPFIGIRYTMVTPDIQKEKKLSVDYGALLVAGGKEPAIVPGSPAEKAGLREGDIILEINNQKIKSDNNVSKIIQSLKIGSEVIFKVLRSGEIMTIQLRLEERRT